MGNSLAIRLPAAVVDALDLKEGDRIEVTTAGTPQFEIRRDRSREAVMARRRPLPPGFTCDRIAANER